MPFDIATLCHLRGRPGHCARARFAIEGPSTTSRVQALAVRNPLTAEGAL